MASTQPRQVPAQSGMSLHRLGVISGLAAGAWLGVAEAPTKLVTVGFSPFIVSLGMVAGVFVARWTVPMLLKGTGYVFTDIKEKKHLIVWAILAGMLWAVANTLTVFAIRNVGLSIAFPLWNTNSVIGLFWGWLLFNELKGAGAKAWTKVLGGSAAIMVGACILAYATAKTDSNAPHAATLGIMAALGAGVLWGTMYVPYRKAYISGMNPLSFVTVFTFGELGTVFALSMLFGGGWDGVTADLVRAKPALFWLFLGGFCWVLGDLFQQYAAKYIGIGRGIPLSNTNQLWGLAWGALVFGELSGVSSTARMLIIGGSLVMILGAVAISLAEAPASEQEFQRVATRRECERYGLDESRIRETMEGHDPLSDEIKSRKPWEYLVVLVALGIFAYLGVNAQAQPIEADVTWMVILSVATFGLLLWAGYTLYKRTKFS